MQTPQTPPPGMPDSVNALAVPVEFLDAAISHEAEDILLAFNYRNDPEIPVTPVLITPKDAKRVIDSLSSALQAQAARLASN